MSLLKILLLKHDRVLISIVPAE